MFCGKSARCPSLMAWVWISRTHVKAGYASQRDGAAVSSFLFQRTLEWFFTSMLSDLLLPETPEDLLSLASVGTCTHMHSFICKHTHLHIIKNSKSMSFEKAAHSTAGFSNITNCGRDKKHTCIHKNIIGFVAWKFVFLLRVTFWSSFNLPNARILDMCHQPLPLCVYVVHVYTHVCIDAWCVHLHTLDLF